MVRNKIDLRMTDCNQGINTKRNIQNELNKPLSYTVCRKLIKRFERKELILRPIGIVDITFLIFKHDLNSFDMDTALQTANESARIFESSLREFCKAEGKKHEIGTKSGSVFVKRKINKNEIYSIVWKCLGANLQHLLKAPLPPKERMRLSRKRRKLEPLGRRRKPISAVIVYQNELIRYLLFFDNKTASAEIDSKSGRVKATNQFMLYEDAIEQVRAWLEMVGIDTTTAALKAGFRRYPSGQLPGRHKGVLLPFKRTPDGKLVLDKNGVPPLNYSTNESVIDKQRWKFKHDRSLHRSKSKE